MYLWQTLYSHVYFSVYVTSCQLQLTYSCSYAALGFISLDAVSVTVALALSASHTRAVLPWPLPPFASPHPFLFDLIFYAAVSVYGYTFIYITLIICFTYQPRCPVGDSVYCLWRFLEVVCVLDTRLSCGFNTFRPLLSTFPSWITIMSEHGWHSFSSFTMIFIICLSYTFFLFHFLLAFLCRRYPSQAVRESFSRKKHSESGL